MMKTIWRSTTNTTKIKSWDQDQDQAKDTRPRSRPQDAQLSQRDRTAGCVIVYAKSGRLELGNNILRTL